MNQDMCVPCGEGIINIRVGAIIMKDGKFLMMRNDRDNYCYSIGGRIRFNETSEEAVIREVREETGTLMKTDHLGFIHENYFVSDSLVHPGKVYYEISYYYYMKVPADFEPVCTSYTEDRQKEYPVWMDKDAQEMIFPSFFRTSLDSEDMRVHHIVDDDRVFIRKMRPEDLDDLYEILSDPETMKYMEPPYTYEKTEEFLHTYGLCEQPYILAAEDSRQGFIGYVIFHSYEEDSMEIGWVLKKDRRTKGIGSLLTIQLMTMAKNKGKNAVIECVPENKASVRIARKFGFEKTSHRDGLDVYTKYF